VLPRLCPTASSMPPWCRVAGESYRLKDKRCAGIMARPQPISAANGSK
jgi:hypothetical protein